MVTFPHCKINLGLNIVSKRADGYHDIVTCFYPVPWTDMLEIIPSEKLSFETSGNSIPGNEADNLCLKAYRLLHADFKIPSVQIHLHKTIPTGAGLGGGSSDGAFTLRTLNAIFNLGLSKDALKVYASKLGSDCAFFIEDRPMLGTGRGEVLEPVDVDLKGMFLVLIKPESHVSTAEAYSGVIPAAPKYGLKESIQLPIAQWNGVVVNDFEPSVFQTHPVIGEIKRTLNHHGALYASMSGSGSAVFGIFSREQRITDFSGMITWSGYLT